jgi:hypothetical protein
MAERTRGYPFAQQIRNHPVLLIALALLAWYLLKGKK